MHPRRDVGALVAADPGSALGIAVERKAPDPGAGDQQQRARDCARREQPRGRPTARQQRHCAGGSDREPTVGERCIRSEASALAPREREATCDQGDPDHGAVGEAEGAEQEPTGDEGQHDRDPRAALAGVGPQRQVEQDPRAAGEREQRKDEPDEGDVDRKGLRDTRADPCDHPLVRARGEGGQRHAGSS